MIFFSVLVAFFNWQQQEPMQSTASLLRDQLILDEEDHDIDSRLGIM